MEQTAVSCEFLLLPLFLQQKRQSVVLRFLRVFVSSWQFNAASVAASRRGSRSHSQAHAAAAAAVPRLILFAT